MANPPAATMNLSKTMALVLAGIMAVTIPELRAQPESLSKFEVASVRFSPPLQFPLAAPIRIGVTQDRGRVEFRLMSLQDLILFAYRLKPWQLPDTPDWMTTELFEIHATIPQSAVTAMPDRPCASDERQCNFSGSRVPEMLQDLLAERFGLKIRRENREMPVYTLTVAKSGPKFSEVPPDPLDAEPVFPKAPVGGIVAGVGLGTDGAPARIGQAGGRGFGPAAGPIFDGRGNPMTESLHMELGKASMSLLADTLTSMLDRPVVDRTGLTGIYEIGFDLPSQGVWRAVMKPMPGKVRQAAFDAADPGIFQSVQSLGLRLEKDRAPVEVIVIEHLDKTPTEN